MSWTMELKKSSQQVLSICGNSFKTVGKAFQVKLVERMPIVCKVVKKVKGGYFVNLKYILICITVFFGYYMIYMFVFVFSILFYNIEIIVNP
jgi:ribosomal protein S1